MIEISPGIVVDPKIRSGRPVIKGTRVPVAAVLARIAAGLSYADVEAEYAITHQDILNVLRYAAQRIAEEQVWATS